MTHNERVLQLLSDGLPHTHHELYALHVIAHSRIADLRAQGHRIDQWREGDLYLYRLRDAAEDEAVKGSRVLDAFPAEGKVSRSSYADRVGGVSEPVQLELVPEQPRGAYHKDAA